MKSIVKNSGFKTASNNDWIFKEGENLTSAFSVVWVESCDVHEWVSLHTFLHRRRKEVVKGEKIQLLTEEPYGCF